jgi:hypothetical protein
MHNGWRSQLYGVTRLKDCNVAVRVCLSVYTSLSRFFEHSQCAERHCLPSGSVMTAISTCISGVKMDGTDFCDLSAAGSHCMAPNGTVVALKHEVLCGVPHHNSTVR